ncbi:hypothetical protein QUA00_07045 [Microcoleus sp. T2B6]|uniref:hypothetical protein n=1 Tax=Microcoleus sp. T2B6 TaxID=3055424 RepID=UPI002FD09A35
MRLRQYLLAGFTSALTVMLTGLASFAFNIIPPKPGATSNWRPVSRYNIGDLENPMEGVTEVDTTLWTEPIPQGGTWLFSATLNLWALSSEKGIGGWNFQTAQQELRGNFEIVNYLACGYEVLCGIENPGERDPRSNGVGATFYLKYHPAPTDPQPGQEGKQLHWIQMVRANYGDGVDGFIPHIPFIDNGFRSDDPYYDTTGMAGESFFIDRPYSPGELAAQRNNYFDAEVYLVEEILRPATEPREVTIYNGIRWGWRNEVIRPQTSKKFSDSLASGFELDRFNLSDLTPGSKYIAWTNNDLPSNRCNPNTFLSTDNDSGFQLGFDDDSSRVGNGFASALTGTVGSSGNINLNVGAAGGGARGQDTGNYELFVDVYDPQDSPDFSVASSGGGGFGKEMRGLTQQNPILPNSIQNGWQVFNKVPGCRWFDPPTTYGFEFQSLEDTLFTEILDFPAGDDQEFTVAVGDSILGNFSPGDKLDFVSLLGYPVDKFRITGIDSLFGETAETAFPIQLAFKEREGSFKMRQISKPIDAESVPEPGSIVAAKGMVLWFAGMRHILRKKRQAG